MRRSHYRIFLRHYCCWRNNFTRSMKHKSDTSAIPKIAKFLKRRRGLIVALPLSINHKMSITCRHVLPRYTQRRQCVVSKVDCMLSKTCRPGVDLPVVVDGYLVLVSYARKRSDSLTFRYQCFGFTCICCRDDR